MRLAPPASARASHSSNDRASAAIASTPDVCRRKHCCDLRVSSPSRVVARRSACSHRHTPIFRPSWPACEPDARTLHPRTQPNALRRLALTCSSDWRRSLVRGRFGRKRERYEAKRASIQEGRHRNRQPSDPAGHSKSASTPFLTNESVFDLTTQPRELVVIGAGASCVSWRRRLRGLVPTSRSSSPAPTYYPRGIARRRRQSWNRACERTVPTYLLGDAGHRPSAGQKGSLADGMMETTHDIGRRAARRDRARYLAWKDLGARHGRCGVRAAEGITVDDRLRTSKRAHLRGRRCLLHGTSSLTLPTQWRESLSATRCSSDAARMSSLVIPWCTFTSPEVARVGGGR